MPQPNGTMSNFFVYLDMILPLHAENKWKWKTLWIERINAGGSEALIEWRLKLWPSS